MSHEITAILYTRPHGRTKEITVSNIRPEAAEYLKLHDVKVSLEDCGFDNIIYFDDDTMMPTDPETPWEIIVAAKGRSCEDCMDEGVAKLKDRKANPEKWMEPDVSLGNTAS